MADYTITLDVLVKHAKLRQSVSSLKNMRKSLVAYSDQEQASTGAIEFKAETRAFVQACEADLDVFINASSISTPENYTTATAQALHDEGIAVDAEIQVILNDPDIEDPTNTQRYKQLEERKIYIDRRLPLLAAEGFVASLIAPVSDFVADALAVAPGVPIQLTDLSINQPTEWIWQMIGGTPEGSNEQNPVVTYNTPGVYNIGLRAKNGYGHNDMIKSGYITVAVPPVPVADFSADVVAVAVGAPVTFTDLSTESPIAWAWTFLGGTPVSSTVQNPVVTYATPGVYNVSLVAQNVNGSSVPVTKTAYITVT